MTSVSSKEEKLEKLRTLLSSFGKVLIGFSGGVDSTFLVRLAADVLGKDNVVVVVAQSESVPEREVQEAQVLAKRIGVRCELVSTEELSDEQYTSNPINRCYFCRTELFRKLRRRAQELGIDCVCDGSNWDDQNDWRPGRKAAEEAGVRSPLAEAGLTKAEIRALSLELGLPTWDKPASPCLSSRFPYGRKITAEGLHQIEQAEEFLRGLGFRQFRVRHHGDTARLEIDPQETEKLLNPETRQCINASLRVMGFRYVVLDLEGFRSGRLNEEIEKKENAHVQRD